MGWFLGNPAKPQIKAAGHEARRDHSFAWVGHHRKRRRPTSMSAPAPCPAPRRNLLCRQSVSCGRERVRGFAEIATPRMNLSAGYRD